MRWPTKLKNNFIKYQVMKKIFTLVACGLVAMGAAAQESWSAANADLTTVQKVDNTSKNVIIHTKDDPYPMGTYGDSAKEATVTNNSTEKLQDQVLTASTANVTVKAVSTLNLGETEDGWQLAGSDIEALTTKSGFPVDFTTRLKAKSGNPTLTYLDFYELNSDGDAVHRVSGEVWAPGATSLPAKGCYIEVTPKTAGKLTCGVYVNKGNHALYIIDESTLQLLAPANVAVKFFYQNNTFPYNENGDIVVTGTLPDDYILQHTNGLTQNRPAMGTVTFDVEAGKTYMLMNPKSQLGFYGYYFESTANGIADIQASKAADANAPIYNLAGQVVNKSYKGIVISNGRKYLQK